MSKTEKIKKNQFNSIVKRILEGAISRRITEYKQSEKIYIDESQEELYPIYPEKSESLVEYHKYLEKYDEELGKV